jgi:DNA ligase-associated metallophosphoesterase
MTRSEEIKLRGQNLLLLAERAVYWKQRKMLIVADPHFGKSEIFRADGIPIPLGITVDNIDRLSTLLERFQPLELLVVGDLMHGRVEDHRNFDDIISQWRQRWSHVRFSLIAGNHDNLAGQPPAVFRLDQVISVYDIQPFVFIHKPTTSSNRYVISGHVHPAVTVSGMAHQKETLPCFCFGPKRALLPAFGSFTGQHVIQTTPEERVFVIADNEIIEMEL